MPRRAKVVMHVPREQLQAMYRTEKDSRMKEAEVFAAYLLIPEDKLNRLLEQEWVKGPPDPIPELAEEFQVPENFMKKRLEFRRRLNENRFQN